jgi:hypothetical protein
MESTLSLAKKDIDAEIGAYLGWGRGALFNEPEWSAEKKSTIKATRESGLRQFYHPPPQQGVAYDWSFLRPTVSVTVASGTQTLELPDDFGGLEGRISITGDNNNFLPVEVVGEGRLRNFFAAFPDATGRPEYAAVRPKKMANADKGQRQELYIYPETDAEYTLNFQYYLLPNALSGDRDYAYGGMAHAETILESCLAIAEQRLDNKIGVHSTKWMERLAASINHDRKLKQQAFGYNGDNSDYRFSPRGHRLMHMDQTVTLAGQEP